MAVQISGSPNDCRVLAPAEDGGRGRSTGPGDAVRRAVLRVLAVAALALAGLLVFGLLPGGRDAAMVTPRQYPLPSVPLVHDPHPHGPNRPVDKSRLVIHPRA